MSSYRGLLPPLNSNQEQLAKRLHDHVWLLAGDIGARSLTCAPENLERAAGYIEHVLKTFGFEPEREEFTVEVMSQRNAQISSNNIKFPSAQHKTWNVIAEARGASPELVIVGAHYDSVYDCPAANDNGSGVAALLEIAGTLKKEKLNKTVRFIAFTNEEPPFFRTADMGSFRHAERCRNRSEKIAGMICLETIGFYTDKANSQSFPHPAFGFAFPTTGNFISFVSNLQSRSLLQRCLKSFRREVKFPSEGISVPGVVKGVDFSDHHNFWKLGYPAVMVTDTAFYRYPHYHEPEDTPDKINYETLARVVDGLTGVVRDLAM
jgi:hypothetical protein